MHSSPAILSLQGLSRAERELAKLNFDNPGDKMAYLQHNHPATRMAAHAAAWIEPENTSPSVPSSRDKSSRRDAKRSSGSSQGSAHKKREAAVAAAVGWGGLLRECSSGSRQGEECGREGRDEFKVGDAVEARVSGKKWYLSVSSSNRGGKGSVCICACGCCCGGNMLARATEHARPCNERACSLTHDDGGEE